MPSINTRSWFTTESRVAVSDFLPSERTRAMASNSSKTTTCNSLFSAICATSSASPGRGGTSGGLAKRSRSCASDEPTYLSIISGPETTVAGRRLSDLARRFAKYDLPQPGGPYNNRPLSRSQPSSSSKPCGAQSGVQTRLRISSSASPMPPTSSTTWSQRPGSRERYCAAARAADSRASKYAPRFFFSASASRARSLAFDMDRVAASILAFSSCCAQSFSRSA